ncbi:unnamed protein product [Rangifer tarandus platyrhynchus]|uniref:Uncharacterized protein n=1 Tax=Rangifer tarandus platyrhynchus TaxID=3082113 RepID=A0AC59YIM8_RANTA
MSQAPTPAPAPSPGPVWLPQTQRLTPDGVLSLPALRAPGTRGACGWDSLVPRGFAAPTRGQRPLGPRPTGACPSPEAPEKGAPADCALFTAGGAGGAGGAGEREPAGKCNSATSRPPGAGAELRAPEPPAPSRGSAGPRARGRDAAWGARTPQVAVDATSLREVKANAYTQIELFGLGADEGPKRVAGVGFPDSPRGTSCETSQVSGPTCLDESRPCGLCTLGLQPSPIARLCPAGSTKASPGAQAPNLGVGSPALPWASPEGHRQM